DGDGSLEVVSGTRGGQLYAWHTQGRSTGSVQWPTFRHDNRNTGNYGTALPFGVRHVDNLAAIECPLPQSPDPGTGDAAAGDDGGAMGDATGSEGPSVSGGGCGCRAAGSGRGATHVGALAALALVLAARRRKARRN